MPWSTSDRKARLPKDWTTIRLRILRRDRYQCQHRDANGYVCLLPAGEVDHVVAGDDHRDSNLQAICTWHHRRKSSAEGAAARTPNRSSRRPTEPHPGAYRD